MVIRVREILREECNDTHSPNPELMVLLDPSPIPNPCLTAVQAQGKKEPQMIITLLYIWCMKLRMMYIDDARVASSNIIHHHKLQAWETSGGKLGTLASYRHMRAILPKFLNCRSPGCGTAGST